MNTKATRNALITGRFNEAVNTDAQTLSASHPVDRALYIFDIEGSLSHARMLSRQGIITQKELSQITTGLTQVRKEIEQGQFTWKDSLEDVHMHIESRLIEIVGEAGKKLHTGRSRNDQVATDFRLYCKDAVHKLSDQLRSLQRIFIQQAEAHQNVMIPGYTHLQQAQMMRGSQYFLAYVNMIDRDLSRLQDAFKRIDVLPLGSGALAGTGLGNDRDFLVQDLGFTAMCPNSLDAVSDRDFVMELLFVLSTLAIHLSRFCEEVVIFSTQEFDMITLSSAFCTGSSLMPQKSNPDKVGS